MDADEAGLGRTPSRRDRAHSDERTVLDRFDDVVTSEALRSVSRQLFADGHYARAVEEALKCMNNEVKQKSGISGQDGASLMRKAFSVNSPTLCMNDFQSNSDRDEQLGYMDIYAGAMTGIRNPRAHEHGLEDDSDVALELLTLANHLMRRLDGASRAISKATGSNRS